MVPDWKPRKIELTGRSLLLGKWLSGEDHTGESSIVLLRMAYEQTYAASVDFKISHNIVSFCRNVVMHLVDNA
jgi:hypothetical protein